jgi:hypothetical protein
MHYLMLVTIALPPDQASHDARRAVYDNLLSDDSFCGSGGRFGCPISDWFLIGGRWSGYLSTSTIGEALSQAILARFPKLGNDVYGIADSHGKEVDALWQALGGQGANPYSRDAYQELGYPDDAQPLTTALYDALLSKFEGESCVSDGCHCEFIDLDDEPLISDFVGRKWLVVVDYHN